MKSRALRIGFLAVVAAFGLNMAACSTKVSESVTASIVIDAPPDEVYAWILAPENQVKRVEEIQNLTNITSQDNVTSYNYGGKFMGITFGGEEVMVGVVPGQLIVEKTTGDLDGTYTYIMVAEGEGTKLIKVADQTVTMPTVGLLLYPPGRITREGQKAQDVELGRIKAEIEK